MHFHTLCFSEAHERWSEWSGRMQSTWQPSCRLGYLGCYLTARPGRMPHHTQRTLPFRQSHAVALHDLPFREAHERCFSTHAAKRQAVGRTYCIYCHSRMSMSTRISMYVHMPIHTAHTIALQAVQPRPLTKRTGHTAKKKILMICRQVCRTRLGRHQSFSELARKMFFCTRLAWATAYF